MADESKSKDFEFKNDLITDWKGYVSSADKTNIKGNYCVRGSQNVYKKLSGTMSVRQGQKRLGVVNTVLSPVSSEYVWNTSWGATYTMVISNANLYVVINNVWYSLLSGLTKTRYVFDKWFSIAEAKDRLLFVNGDSNIYHWSGGFATILSTTANTITKTGTTSWQQSGISTVAGEKTVVINGTTYTYTGGETTTTLTGVTGDPTGEANGSNVFQSVLTKTNTPAALFHNDFIKVINNQAYIGSYTSRLCYISQNTDWTNYTVPTPRIAGSPELLTLDGALRGIGVRKGNAHIGYGAGYWAVISFSDISNNNILTQKTNVDVKPVSILQAPYAHEFIDSTGDNIIYLGQDQQVHSFGDFNDLFVAGYPSLSQDIARELSKEVFTGGGLRCIGEFVYVTAPNSGKVYLYQVRSNVGDNGAIGAERLWHSPFIWNCTRIDQIDGVVVGFSNANPQIYQLWDTNQWHDDSPSDEHLPYTSVMALGYRGSNRRFGLWSFNKQYTEGYIGTGTPLNLLINYNYQGSTNVITVPINSSSQPVYIFSSLLSSLGDTSIGEEPLGDGGIADIANDQDSLDKFRCINSLSLTNVFEWQPVYYSEAVDSNWEILAVASNATPEPDQQATFIINKKRT